MMKKLDGLREKFRECDMRVLVYGFSKDRGGEEEYMMNLNSISAKKNIFFDYIVEGDRCVYSNKIKEFNGKIYYYSAKNIFAKMNAIREIINNNARKYDYFYFNTSGLFFILPLFYAKRNGIKIVVHAHSAEDPKLPFYLKWLNKINRRFIYKFADIKIACSDLAAKWIFKNIKNVLFVNNGIELRKYVFAENIRNNYRKEFGFSADDIVLIHIGRMSYPKNQCFLMDVVEGLSERFKLVFVGNGKDLLRLKNKNKNKNIIFLGNRDDVASLLIMSDIFLMPSYFEGFPVAAIEAQATGLPCVLSDKITKQAKLTENVKYLPIDDKEAWRNVINKGFDTGCRTEANRILDKNGFSVEISMNRVLKAMEEGAEKNE